VQASCGANLVVVEAGGVGLRARRTFKEGSVVVTGFLDAQAPDTPISESKDGVPILGPFALLNAGCARHAKTRFRFGGETTAAVALKGGMKEGQDVLGRYGDSRWTCACAGCKRPVALTLEA